MLDVKFYQRQLLCMILSHEQSQRILSFVICIFPSQSRLSLKCRSLFPPMTTAVNYSIGLYAYLAHIYFSHFLAHIYFSRFSS